MLPDRGTLLPSVSFAVSPSPGFTACQLLCQCPLGDALILNSSFALNSSGQCHLFALSVSPLQTN